MSTSEGREQTGGIEVWPVHCVIDPLGLGWKHDTPLLKSATPPPLDQGREQTASMTDHTGREWTFGDEPCPYPGGCNLPLRTHIHEVTYPSGEVVVRFYDESATAREST